MAYIQAQIIFKGRVQGVGFRYTAQRFAREYGIAGWVKNLANGDVELLAEAEEAAVHTFLARLEDYFSHEISDEDIDSTHCAHKLQGFEIRF